MNKYKIAFTICDKVMFYLDAPDNTPESRALFVSNIRTFHKNTIADLNHQISQTKDNAKLDELNMLIGRYNARQYFVDKFESPFCANGKTQLSNLAAYDLKVLDIKIPA